MTTSVRSPELMGKLQLWEAGRRLLGYGDWDPDHDEPYQKWSAMQSYRLNLVMKKRNISNTEFLLCADYCRRHHKRIENAVWVFGFIKEAKQEQAELTRFTSDDALTHLIDDALAYERALSDAESSSWIGRLVNARGQYREEVLDIWRKERKPE